MTNDNTAEQLKPCPFCGGAGAVYDLDHDRAGTYWIAACNNESCAYEGHFDKPSRTEAVAAWNTRADSGEAVACDEPIGWWFQHDETGRVAVCINDGVNDRESFLRLNERFSYCGELFTHPSATPDEVRDAARYRLIRNVYGVAVDTCADHGFTYHDALDDAIDAPIAKRERK